MLSKGSKKVTTAGRVVTTMMHSAVCSSVPVGVALRPLLESSRPGCPCSNVLLRRGGHRHALDCQASNRATGFGKLKKCSYEGVEFVGRNAGIEKPKLKQWFVLRAGAAAAGFYYLVASSASTSEEEGSSSNSSSSSASLNGGLDRGANTRVSFLDEEAMASGNQGGNQGNKNLVQALHDAAAVFKSAMEDQESLTRGPWFAQKWLGIDKNAWMRTLAYQAITYFRMYLLVLKRILKLKIGHCTISMYAFHGDETILR